MRWKSPSLALISVFGVLLAACGGTSATPSGGTPFRVALVVNGTLGDKGFFDSANRGVQRMHDELGATTKVVQASPTNPAEWLQDLEAVSTGSYDLVVLGSFQMVDNIKKVSAEHPSQKFIFFDAPIDLPNVASAIYKQNEGSFLAGVLAGLVTTDTKDFPLSKGNKKVGLVGGVDIPIINDFVVGYKKGVAFVDPSIQVLVTYAGTFADPAKGFDQAKAMFDQGADIVYAVAGGTGLGVLKASDTANKYSIGVDSDQNGLYPGHVLASMLKRVDNSVFDLAKKFKDGTLQTGKVYIYGLQNQGVGLVFDTKDVPQSIIDKIKAAEDQVKSGAIQVPTAF